MAKGYQGSVVPTLGLDRVGFRNLLYRTSQNCKSNYVRMKVFDFTWVVLDGHLPPLYGFSYYQNTCIWVALLRVLFNPSLLPTLVAFMIFA